MQDGEILVDEEYDWVRGQAVSKSKEGPLDEATIPMGCGSFLCHCAWPGAGRGMGGSERMAALFSLLYRCII